MPRAVRTQEKMMTSTTTCSCSSISRDTVAPQEEWKLEMGCCCHHKTQCMFYSLGEVPWANLGKTQTIQLFFLSNNRSKLAKFPSGLIWSSACIMVKARDTVWFTKALNLPQRTQSWYQQFWIMMSRLSFEKCMDRDSLKMDKTASGQQALTGKYVKHLMSIRGPPQKKHLGDNWNIYLKKNTYYQQSNPSKVYEIHYTSGIHP